MNRLLFLGTSNPGVTNPTEQLREEEHWLKSHARRWESQDLLVTNAVQIPSPFTGKFYKDKICLN